MSGLQFSCPSCPYQTPNSYDLTKHLLHHSQTKNYPCPDCEKLFFNASDLSRHQRIHQSSKAHHCSFENCSFSTHRKDSLQLHEKTHTGLQSRLQHPCHSCRKRFSSQQIAIRHMKTCESKAVKQENSGKDNLSCDVCEKRFSNKTRLKSHKLGSHQNLLNFQCEVCCKSFVSTAALTKHRLSHQKRFQCDLCQKLFSRKDNLHSHIQTHFKSNRGNTSQNKLTSKSTVEYICSFCHHLYFSKEELIAHFNSYSSCRKGCRDQLCQSDDEYANLKEIPEETLQIIEFEGSKESVQNILYSHLVDKEDETNMVEDYPVVLDASGGPPDNEIILIDNSNPADVLIIEDPVVYV